MELQTPVRRPGCAARYDGHADWYDGFARAALGAARAALEDLLPDGGGLAVEIGCGTGLNAEVLRRRGYQPLGVDISSDQLRLARSRLPVLRADAHALPLPDGAAQAVVAVLVSTDVQDYAGVVAEALRVLAPGGAFVHLGVHPCFVHPFAEPRPDGLLLHPGSMTAGWVATTPHTGDAVRARVGVHHLPLEHLLTALLHRRAPLDLITERGDHCGQPLLLGARLNRPS